MRLTGKASLTRRLTLLFVTASSAVLLALGFFIASSVAHHFEDLDMEVLSGKMELIRESLESVKSPEQMAQLGPLLGHSLVGHQGLEVLIIGSDHTVLFATPNAGFAPELVAASASPHLGPVLRPMIWHLAQQDYRAVVAELPTGLPGKLRSGSTLGQVRDVYQPNTVLVAVATGIAHHQSYMRSFLQTLWLFVAGAAALTGLLGWAAARHGLAPLRAMREQTQGVTAQQLSQRLPVASVPLELAELAQSLNEMLARLEDAFHRLSDFSSDIAHELRTPVSNLMTQTQVALTRARSADEYHSILESNAEELERMTRMISDMLLLAKAENGLVIPNREMVQLATEVRALFDYYEAVAEEKGLHLAMQGDAQVNVDKLMLRRALSNLLSNAVRHASANSTIQVNIESRPDAVWIAMENCGDTIPADYLDRVFDRFFRVDPSRQRSNEGTGLGLAITKSIVLAHGGTIAAGSADGVTTFSISLPHVA